jgi:DNA mismatch repair ATPase MutS
MIKELLFQVKYVFAQLPFNRKKALNEQLNQSFGQLKDATFDFENIEKYFRNKDRSKAHQVLSDKTCNDLDFADLFMFVDRTHSTVGQQYLYHTLRTVTVDEEQTKLDEEIISALTTDAELRVSLQKRIGTLKSKDAYSISTLFQEAHINKPKWFLAVKLLSFASFVCLVLGFFNSLFFILLIGLFCVNFVLHYWNKSNLVQYVNSIPQLLRLNNVASHLFVNPALKKLNPKLPKSIKLINDVKSRMFFFQLEAKLQGEFEIIAWFIFELFKTLFLLEPLLLFGVLKRLDTKRAEIEDVFKFVGHVDVLLSIASLRNGLDTYCLPNITEDTAIIAEEISHPLIYNCTTNSIAITEKSVLLTGSNMSGKTSFIRAIGLNVITGLTLNTCFARSMTFPLMKVFSAIRISDDLMNDKSYYFEEVLTVKELLHESEKVAKNLFLLDELFKGTNTVERISAGKAVLSALAKSNNKILVSTHDIELTDLLADEYELYHFSETVNEKTVGFDYKLKEGKLKNRNAIRILEINDYPTEVVQEAMQISKELDKIYSVKNNSSL